MKNITDSDRLEMGLEMIEEISADAQSLNPKRDWKKSQEAVCEVYRIVHSLRSPACRKNHKDWSDKIDAAIKADRARRGEAKR